MSKSTHFFGQSVLGQLISLMEDNIIARNSRKYQSDRYIKRFTTDHLINKYTLLRKGLSGRFVWKGKEMELKEGEQ